MLFNFGRSIPDCVHKAKSKKKKESSISITWYTTIIYRKRISFIMLSHVYVRDKQKSKFCQIFLLSSSSMIETTLYEQGHSRNLFYYDYIMSQFHYVCFLLFFISTSYMFRQTRYMKWERKTIRCICLL